MHLRTEHTHFFSLSADASTRSREAGHYHYHVTPQDIAYEGYFVPCEHLYRVENAVRRAECLCSKP